MTIFTTISIIIIIICFLIYLYYLICMNRNNKVFELRSYVLYNFPIEKYAKIPSYHKMVYNLFIPLNKKYWDKKLGEKK